MLDLFDYWLIVGGPLKREIYFLLEHYKILKVRRPGDFCFIGVKRKTSGLKFIFRLFVFDCCVFI